RGGVRFARSGRFFRRRGASLCGRLAGLVHGWLADAGGHPGGLPAAKRPRSRNRRPPAAGGRARRPAVLGHRALWRPLEERNRALSKQSGARALARGPGLSARAEGAWRTVGWPVYV